MKEGIAVSRFKIMCTVLLVISVVIVSICLGPNIVLRTTDVYQFHFNDSQCVDRLYTSMTSSQMADEIASFMNSFRPDEFQVHDNTGYDELPIFDSRDSYNMLVLKKIMDCSAIVGIIGLIIMISLYVWFVKEDEKKLLRNAHLVGSGIGLVGILIQSAVIYVPQMRGAYFRLWGMRTPAADSKLQMIMGDEFWSCSAFFLAAISVILLLVLIYINYRITRPPRIFF